MSDGRFERAYSEVRPETRKSPGEEQIDEDAKMRSELGGWAATRECNEVFIPWLWKWHDDLDAQESLCLGNHAALIEKKAQRDALQFIVSKLKGWGR